jgi:hypothetical protein
MSQRALASDQMRAYFRAKSASLAAIAKAAVCDHPGLIGGHREEIQRIYLREILPKRFEVGRGMVYGPIHRTREADIVIWDAQHYPSLPMADHALYFAESVRAVLECKSQWSEDEFRDVLEKCGSVTSVVTLPTPALADRIAMLELEIGALKEGRNHHGILSVGYHMGTAAVFLSGGVSFNGEQLAPDLVDRADERWPDVMLLLEAGRIVLKRYEAADDGLGGRGWVEFVEGGDDALLIFTGSLLALLTDRVLAVEEPLYMQKYVPELSELHVAASFDFPLTRPVPNRVALWA